MAIIKQGDTTLITFTLQKDGDPFAITETSTVEVRFYRSGVLVAELGTIVCSKDETDADWFNSIVTIKLAAEDTADLTLYAKYEPRITIVDDSAERLTFTGRELETCEIASGF